MENSNEWIQPYLQDEVFKSWETDRLQYVEYSSDLLQWLLCVQFKNNTHKFFFGVDEYSDAWVMRVEVGDEKLMVTNKWKRKQVLLDYESDINSIVERIIPWFGKVLLKDPDTRLEMLLNVKPIILRIA